MLSINRSLFITSLFLSTACFAGGPLILEGTNGNTPVSYSNPNITIHAEGGTLGLLSNSAADTLMVEAVSFWNNVNTSTVAITLDDTQILTDINIGNFSNFLPNVSGSISNADDGLNPIAYDNNGEIIDAFFGSGQSDFTIGFAASFFNVNGTTFIEGYSVINGKNLGLTNTEFKLLVAHEIGHFIGLDHSQVNIDNNETDFGSPSICSTASLDNYPVMYPFVCRNIETLHADDISAISALYPVANIADSFGVIQGLFLDELGNAILGANIWVENTVTGDTVSIVSDFLLLGTGFYQLYLAPGTYILHANSINPLFNGGSSIGPYSLSLSGKSFTAPHPITEVIYQGTAIGTDEIISVASNTTINIDFNSLGVDSTAATTPPTVPVPDPEPEPTITTTTIIESSDSSSGGASSIHFLITLVLIISIRQRHTRIQKTKSNQKYLYL